MDTVMIALYCIHLALIAGVPVEVSREMHLASDELGIDRYDLAAYLISEHSGPQADWSLLSSVARGDDTDWYNARDGSDGERGIFQTMPRWARKAGYTAEQLDDPIVSTRVGAYVLAQAVESHRSCESRRYNLHRLPIRHAKCRKSARDDTTGQCAYSARKWWKVRVTIGSLFPKNLKALGHDHNEYGRRVLKRAKRDMRRSERRALRKALADG